MKVGPPLEEKEIVEGVDDDGGSGKKEKYRKHMVKLENCATGDVSIVVMSEGLLKRNNPNVFRHFLKTKKILLAENATIYLEKEMIKL